MSEMYAYISYVSSIGHVLDYLEERGGYDDIVRPASCAYPPTLVRLDASCHHLHPWSRTLALAVIMPSA